MRLAAVVLSVCALAACAEMTEAVDSTARAGAKGVVTETLATRFPQVPKQLIEPFTNCIIDYASAMEVREFARAAVVGVDETTVTAVRSILARPETRTCLQARSLENGII
tara:strand:- start:1535 stop:1864 length:330 start_codon:yes stop_codon:yes gene_type:complete